MSASQAPLLTHRWPGSESRPRGQAGRMMAVLVLHAGLGWLLLSATGQRLVEKVAVPVRLLLTDSPVQDAKTPPDRPEAVAPRALARPSTEAPSPLAPAVPAPPPIARETPPSSPPPAAAPSAPPALAPPALTPAPTPATSQAPQPPAATATTGGTLTGAPAVPPPATSPAVPKPAAVVPSTAAAPPSPPPRIVGGLKPGSCPRPAYPEVSKRLEEEGTVVLRFLVAPDGKVLQAEVEKSSGYRRLDEAARTGLAGCTFEPATVDGKPVRTWATVPYTWRLE